MNTPEPKQNEMRFDDSDENTGFNGAELSDSVLAAIGIHQKRMSHGQTCSRRNCRYSFSWKKRAESSGLLW